MDWTDRLHVAAETSVLERVDLSTRNRIRHQERVREVGVSEPVLGDLRFTSIVEHQRNAILYDGRVVAEYDVARPWVDVAEADSVGGTAQELRILDRDVQLQLRTHGSEKVDGIRVSLEYYVLTAEGRSWTFHWVGGRLAGERLVLRKGQQPGVADPLVVAVPAARDRQLKRPLRGRAGDSHRTSWAPGVLVAEVLMVELMLLADRPHGMDYLGTQIAGVAADVVGLRKIFAPVPERFPSKDD